MPTDKKVSKLSARVLKFCKKARTPEQVAKMLKVSTAAASSILLDLWTGNRVQHHLMESGARGYVVPKKR